jgi:hypothetical protein
VRLEKQRKWAAEQQRAVEGQLTRARDELAQLQKVKFTGLTQTLGQL